MRSSRRAQVTLFIIIGLALLIGVVLYFVLRPKTDAVSDVVPASFEPLQAHVQQCLQDVTIDALKTLAMHGGYLDPLDKADAGRQLRLDARDPTGSDLVAFNVLDNTSAIPYYYYLSSPNTCRNCLLSTLTPTKELMESRTQKYIIQHLPDCLNFGQFVDFQVTPATRQSVAVTFTNVSVIVVYDRLIEMRQGDSVTRPARFTQRLPVPFLRYFDAARQITQREIDTQFLENYLLYLVSANSGIEASLPPLGGYEESFSPKFWVRMNVEQTYRDYVQSVTPALQVLDTKGTLPPPTTGDPYVDGFLRMTYLDLFAGSGVNASDLRVTIFAPNAPLYLNVNPHRGALIRPVSQTQAGILVIPPRQVNYYDFFYDLSVPFIVEIRHEDAIPGTDISFLFALEANVRENKNMVQWLLGHGTIPWSADFVSFNISDPVATTPGTTPLPLPEGFPRANFSDTVLNAPSQSYAHDSSLTTLLCEEPLRTSHLSVRTFDARTNRLLQDVTMSQICGLYAACSLGQTQNDTHNVYAVLDVNASPCMGGLLKAEKAGYNTLTVPLSLRSGQSVRAPDIVLEPFVTKRVRIEKVQLRRGLLNGFPEIKEKVPLDANKETVFVTFVRQPQGYGESPVSATALFSNESVLDTVLLIPGLYEVRATYLDNEGFVIKKGCQRIRGNDIPANDTPIKPAPWGGLELTNETSFWLAQRSDLYAANDLVIPVFVAPPPLCIDDLEAMGESKDYSRRFPTDAQPRFEN